jgi:hypothetical protein
MLAGKKPRVKRLDAKSAFQAAAAESGRIQTLTCASTCYKKENFEGDCT